MGDRFSEKITITEVFVTKDGEERKKKLKEKVVKLINKKKIETADKAICLIIK
ncbi:hypothetical protein PL321_14490 [Caloramator sp. mosi_1]|uniref:hypothetical protein n=1 Tax=Caloramator sp. mosi_1 TaxID=3023090 RepID=UPI00235FCAF9|nr:hypothetical protein [Caloramator sp. mosi_1]WDC83745.1 hypothetical protein PL321_14490 [Caloramator sp. mosi_1]